MGRTVITTRSYPVEAISRDARVFLFNNGTNEVELQQISAWQMSPIEITNIGLD
jgi:beta-fructofuranosidase